MQKIINLISRANEEIDVYSTAIKACAAEPENEGFEEKSERAFAAYWNTCDEIADEIVLLSNGKIGKMTALKLAFGQRKHILKVLG